MVARLFNRSSSFFQLDRLIFLDLSLVRLCKSLDSLVFIQVAANNGMGVDPIFDNGASFGWSGIKGEPMPDSFFRLSLRDSRISEVDLIDASITKELNIGAKQVVEQLVATITRSGQFCQLEGRKCELTAVGVADLERPLPRRAPWGRWLSAAIHCEHWLTFVEVRGTLDAGAEGCWDVGSEKSDDTTAWLPDRNLR